MAPAGGGRGTSSGRHAWRSIRVHLHFFFASRRRRFALAGAAPRPSNTPFPTLTHRRVGGSRPPCRPTQRVPPATATLARRRRGGQNGRPHLPRAVPVPHDARPLPRGAARLLLIRVPVPALSQLCACRSLPSSSSGWQRDNLVVSLRFEYTDAEYNDANSSMLAAIILTFICLAVQVRKWRPGDPSPPPARPPARPAQLDASAPGHRLLRGLHYVRRRAVHAP